MNKYVKDFVLRGLMFGGFGPIVTAIVLLIISFFTDVNLTAVDLFTAIISTYLLAFVQAGSSIFNQIEHWPVLKSISIHFAVLYILYSVCYLVNSWIPFEPKVLIAFSVIFVSSYAVIYAVVYFIVKRTAKQLNKTLI